MKRGSIDHERAHQVRVALENLGKATEALRVLTALSAAYEPQEIEGDLQVETDKVFGQVQELTRRVRLLADATSD